MERGKMPSSGRGGKSKAPQHPQDIFALGSKSTVPVSRDPEKRNIHKPSTSAVERKRETTGFGSQPPNKRSRIGSPAEAVGGTSLEVDPVDLVPNVLQALDTLNSDKLLGLLTGAIRLLKSQRSKPDPILCMGLLYLTKIRPNMFAHETVTNSLCTLLKREQGAAFKNKGNPLVFVLACNMLYAGHRESNNWPDIFIKVYIEDALNERWWVECSWCKCLVENIVTAFGTKQPPSHLIPTDNTLGTMSPSGSGSPLMGSTEEDVDNTELEYTVCPRYSSSYEAVEGLVLEAIKDQIQRRSAAPDAIGKGFLKLLAATCGFPEIRMISASRLEAWLNSGKLWRVAQELLAYVCVNCDACGPTAARDHEVLAQLARMRLKTKPLQAAYQACLREMVSESPALLRSVVTHTIYNELSNVRSPNNMAVLAALIQAQPTLVPAAMADTYLELLLRPEEYLRPLRALTREVVRGSRESGAAAALARALASPPPHEAPADRRERAFLAIADLLSCCALLAGSAAAHARGSGDVRAQLSQISCMQGAALSWLLETAVPCYRPSRHDFMLALNKIMFVEPAESYSKVDNWPAESERALIHRMCCEAPLSHHNLLRIMFIALSKDIPISPAEVFELVEQLVRRACALPAEDSPLQVDKLEVADYIFQLCQFNPPDNITLPQGYTPPPLAITSLYWRGWVILTMIAAHNPLLFAERAAATYPTLRALIETCITNRPSLEWSTSTAAEAERTEAERAAILQLETHLAAASNAKLPVTELSSRLLSQLTTLEPLGPARKPPQAVIESLSALSTQLRLGKLLCRQPALLLSLVERHGTRRAMPWLHQLLRQDQLELSVLPVQCLCEFLSAGAVGGGAGGKAGELCAHLRRTLHDTLEGARALLHYYTARLAHAHAATRAAAARGLKLVLMESEDATEMDYTANVSPEEWLDLLWELRHWEGVREDVVARIRAACLVECVPAHVAAYVHFLARYVRETPLRDHTDIILDLSQVMMERTSVTGHVLGTGEPGREPAPAQQRTLHALAAIMLQHLQKLFSSGPGEDAGATWSAGERVTLQWPSGRRAVLHIIVAHAHLKLLCLGPSAYDTNQEMYSWLQSVWVGSDAPQAFLLDSEEEAVLLPDWLRLHLVRSARPCLLEAGLRGLPAHKLALFIQTFGMPVASMSALLNALDACPAAAVVRLGVERGYMAQLLRVQRARGARGGAAFAAALRLQPPQYPPDDNLFSDESLPSERVEDWISPEPRALQLELVPPVLSTAFGTQRAYAHDVHTALADLTACIAEEVKQVRAAPEAPCPYTNCVLSYLQLCAAGGCAAAAGLLRRPAPAAVLLRALLPLPSRALPQIASSLLAQCVGVTGPVVSILQEMSQGSHLVIKCESDTPDIPPGADRDQLVALLESATPSTLEAIGNKIIESQDTSVIVDVISCLLERNQEGYYESKIKCESGAAPAHVLSARGRGCGLLLDWLAELQRETHPEKQMHLMFVSGGAQWRPLLVTLLAHRASWRTLQHCLSALLLPNGNWSPSAVLDFAETLIGSPRIWQGRDKSTPKHASLEDTLRLHYTQLDVLIQYVILEATAAEDAGGVECMRRRVESRLPLVLRCAGAGPALLAATLAAARRPALTLLLYMKVPKIRQLLQECEERPPVQCPLQVPPESRAAAAASTSATDAVSHAILTHIPHRVNVSKEHTHKVQCMEYGIRSVWSRVVGAGSRALPLAAALVRGARAGQPRPHHHLLCALETLPDCELFAAHASEELESILECFLKIAAAAAGRDANLVNRIAALLRRHAATRPHRAAHLLHKHHQIVQSIPVLSALQTPDISAPTLAAPPVHALEALQRRNDTPDNLAWLLQEVELWGSRRGGGWGGAACAGSVLRAAAPLAASPHAALRHAALDLLAKLLPTVTDTQPGLQAILECLDSELPEVTQSALDKLPELVAGMQEHAARLLTKVFELGVKSRYPVEPCLAKCVVTINMMRGC